MREQKWLGKASVGKWPWASAQITWFSEVFGGFPCCLHLPIALVAGKSGAAAIKASLSLTNKAQA